MTGRTVSHYRIVEKLGAGGMGEVWRAEDLRLSRPVALKFVPEEFGREQRALDRFQREARAASSLNHPNICTIYDIGEEGGRRFIVMELLEGQPLSGRIAAGPLKTGEIVDIGIQIADGLEAAHAKAIVHRDLKPPNIFLGPRGTVKILDFGVAKIPLGAAFAGSQTITLKAGVTDPGSTVGTIAYMSPEQARGEALDGRTDLYSLGVVLYEMATGARPFQGATSAVLFEAILNRTPPPPPQLNPEIPHELGRIIAKAMEKDPELRYQTASGIRADLKQVRRDSESGNRAVAPAPVPPRRTALLAFGLVVAAALLLSIVLLWRARTPAVPRRNAVAVLYFSNLSQDPALDWLDRGLTEMLTTNLTEIKGIDVLSTERVASILERLGRKQVTAEIAPELARRAGAQTFISGALMRLGQSRLRLDVRAQDAANGQILFSEKIEGENANAVFKMVDGITARMATRFTPTAEMPENGPAIENAATANLEAYRRYQLGRDYARRFLFREAIREYEEAVRLDPQFALALTQLAKSYSSLGDYRAARGVWDRVEPLAAHLSRKDRLTYQAVKATLAYEPENARRAYEALLSDFPRESEARAALADVYAQDNHYERGVALIRDGLALDPNAAYLWNQLSYIQARGGNTRAAMEANERYQTLLPGDPNPVDSRGDLCYLAGRDDEAAAAYRKSVGVRPAGLHETVAYLKLALVYAGQRKSEDATAALHEFAQRATGRDQLRLPLFEGHLEEERGSLDRARELYENAAAALLANRDVDSAADPILCLSGVSFLMGDPARALSFASRHNVKGTDMAAVCWLEAANGKLDVAHGCLNDWAAAKGRDATLYRIQADTLTAFMRHDAAAVLAAAGAAGDREDEWLLFYRGHAHLWRGEHDKAAQLLARAIRRTRDIGTMTLLRRRNLLLRALCHFYLGQAHEGAGRPSQASAEYRDFLSHFGPNSTPLPQVTTAREALKRLGSKVFAGFPHSVSARVILRCRHRDRAICPWMPSGPFEQKVFS